MRTDQKNKLKIICKSMLNQEIDILSGCREIYEIYQNSDFSEQMPKHMEYLVLCADEYPIPEKRKLYSDDYLKKMDEDMNCYIESVASMIKEECLCIIKGQ